MSCGFYIKTVQLTFELPVQMPVQMLLELVAKLLDQNVNDLEFELSRMYVDETTPNPQ